MRMDLGTRNTLLYDFMHCMTAVSLEMSDEPNMFLFCRSSRMLYIQFSLPICRTIHHTLAEVFPILLML